MPYAVPAAEQHIAGRELGTSFTFNPKTEAEYVLRPFIFLASTKICGFTAH